ncbi:hypothetical protein LCI18_014715 [Fusarium solani-melongenae]|uniref:Uncharacterized protein n=1 Tax=Fusarium solani subsp. cucurbitae TaxID=2747967 RepID=A0ACD3ZRT4_FUSSC|nr:hypothetical protein LCI18_014715 [Fusarium solani-melongenae]
MSGFEIAGIVLGGVPLLLEAFKSWEEISQRWKLWIHIKKEFDSYRADIEFYDVALTDNLRELLFPILQDEARVNELTANRELLFLMLQDEAKPLIGPFISGAVDWDVGFRYSADLEQTQAGYPGASPLLWFWYYYSSEDRRSYVRRAAAYASIAWDGTTIDEGHCLHIMNDDGFPVNSSILDATNYPLSSNQFDHIPN